MIRHESSLESPKGTPTESGVSAKPPVAAEQDPEKSMTADGALRLAIKLAVDAGDYERASAVLDVLKNTPKAASAKSLTFIHDRKR
jgi:hypothetical protein